MHYFLIVPTVEHYHPLRMMAICNLIPRDFSKPGKTPWKRDWAICWDWVEFDNSFYVCDIFKND